ncbi:MAG TPA: phosphate signaling complex protein PhoU [Polyangiaceae bacterium]|nr:phosphate signaling complex protein PhoU [Polyangiaceae bacterium]
MTVDPPKEHSLTHDFEADMRALRELLMAMAGRCRAQLHLALDAFWTGSKEKMADVEMADRAIDRDEKSADALVLRILALRQPVARDLRMLTASFRLVMDLERIGDEAVDLARGTPSSAPDGEPAYQHLKEMTARTEKLLDSAIDAFFKGDTDAAVDARRVCDTIAQLYADIVRETIAFTARYPNDVVSAIGNLNVAKCLERVATHAANIAQATLFVAGCGDMPR